MKTPKSLLKLAAQVSGTCERLRFRDQIGKYHTGYAIVDSDNNELLEIEPVHYSNGDRWKVCQHNGSLKYIKTLKGFTADIKPGYTGFKFHKAAVN